MQVPSSSTVHPLSRTTLQLLKNDKHYFTRKTAVESAIACIYRSCGNEAIMGKTQYVFNPNKNPIAQYITQGGQLLSKAAENEFSVYISDLLFALGNAFPGCDVNYHETKGFQGNVVERIISIDWSWS
jgi:hypothetical protein